MDHLKLSMLDFLISVADSRTRPLDFALILQLRKPLSTDSFKAGAVSARSVFPTTRSIVKDRKWIPSDKAEHGVTIQSAGDDGAAVNKIEQFLDHPFDPSHTFPVEQLLIINGKPEARKFVTRFHHIAADGASAVMWLRHQLGVASGLGGSNDENTGLNAPVLRQHKAPANKSRFAFDRVSEKLWSRNGQPSHQRRWTTIQIDAAPLRRRCRKAGGFTYNDLLATCLLEVLGRWNEEHGRKRPRNVSLWFPVNIRNKPLTGSAGVSPARCVEKHLGSGRDARAPSVSMMGFGNGSSRIRIYSRYDQSLSLDEKCRFVRSQIEWSIRNGEWAVPSDPPFARLPLWAIKPLLRGYLNRPSVDMGTSVFTHVDSLGTIDDPVFDNIESIESVGLLHKSHCLAVNAATLRGRTWVTLTYDPNLLKLADIEHLVELYQAQIDQALKEL